MKPSQIVAELHQLKAQFESLAERDKELRAALIALGPGDYLDDDGNKALVIEPAPSVKPSAKIIEELSESLDCGVFNKLFDKVVSYKAKKSEIFRELVSALLPKAAAKKVLEKVEVAGTPYVKLS